MKNNVQPIDQVPCNFRVDVGFRKRLKSFAVERDMGMVEVFVRAVDEYIDRHTGSASTEEDSGSTLNTELLTETQAGDLLGFSPTTMRLSRIHGKLAGHQPPPWLKLGRSVRYRRSDIDAWLKSVAVFCSPDEGLR